MNRHVRIALVSVAIAGLSATLAVAAEPAHPVRVNKRLHRENRRIRAGVKDGSLTKGEAKDLHGETKSIHTQEKDMRKVNGGTLTPEDKKALGQEEKKVSGDIHKERTDGEVRPAGEVNQRLTNQRTRIRAGVKDGSLTPTEAKTLRTDDRAIHSEEKDMRAVDNGKLTPEDKKALNEQENTVSKDIHEERHDADTTAK